MPHTARFALFALIAAALAGAATMTHAGAQPNDTARGGAVSAATLPERYGVRSERADAVRLVDDPLGVAGKVFALTLPPAARDGRPRHAEAYVLNETTRRGPRWYAFSIMLPGNWSPPDTPLTVASIAAGGERAGLPPPLSLIVQGRRLWLDLNASERQGAALTPAAVENQRLPLTDDLGPRQWYCVVVRADWQADLGQGALDVWLENTLVYRTARRNNTYPGAVLIPGVGMAAAGGKNTAARTLYADFIWLDSQDGGKTSLRQMLAQTPCGARR